MFQQTTEQWILGVSFQFVFVPAIAVDRNAKTTFHFHMINSTSYAGMYWHLALSSEVSTKGIHAHSLIATGYGVIYKRGPPCRSTLHPLPHLNLTVIDPLFGANTYSGLGNPFALNTDSLKSIYIYTYRLAVSWHSFISILGGSKLLFQRGSRWYGRGLCLCVFMGT